MNFTQYKISMANLSTNWQNRKIFVDYFTRSHFCFVKYLLLAKKELVFVVPPTHALDCVPRRLTIWSFQRLYFDTGDAQYKKTYI